MKAEDVAGYLNGMEEAVEGLTDSGVRDNAERCLGQLASCFDVSDVPCTKTSDGTDRGRGWFANGSSELAKAREAFDRDIEKEAKDKIAAEATG